MFDKGPIREAIRHLFNSDLAASQSALNEYLREHPEDPLANALTAAVPFYYYVSMRIPEQDTRSIVGVLLGPGIAMPQALQKEIGATLRRTQTLALKCGAVDDPATILALCIVEGVNRDGLALVSKRWAAALAHAGAPPAGTRTPRLRRPLRIRIDGISDFENSLPGARPGTHSRSCRRQEEG
jgi:hypothetical protein